MRVHEYFNAVDGASGDGLMSHLIGVWTGSSEKPRQREDRDKKKMHIGIGIMQMCEQREEEEGEKKGGGRVFNTSISF